MGGLIGRVALKELENEDYDHKFNLYVSYDSPQKGAYIPLGLQWLADDLKFFLPGYVSNSYLVDLIEEIFGFDAPIADLYGILNSNAAKQMLFKHYNDLFESEYTELQDYLEGLGYPEDSRNISFLNGSNITSDQGITDLTIVDISGGLSAPIIIPPYVGHISMQAKFPTQGNSGYETIAGTGIQFEWHLFGILINEFFVGVNHPVEKQNITYYNSPGGFQGRDIDGNSFWHNLLGFNLMQEFSFVPTASSIDLQMDLDDDDDLLFFDNNGAHNLDFIIEHNLTPFDDIYSLNNNTTHVSYNNFDFRNSLELMEIMPDNMFLQNREISNERAFEASNSIVVGNDVTNLTDDIGGQNETHTKNISAGDFILENGSDVKMIAGERIVFRDGFKAEDGCNLLASIETICSNNKTQSYSLKTKPPKIIGSSSFCQDKKYYTFCDDCSIQWSLVGEKLDLYGTGNEFIIPDNIPVGQYTLFSTKETPGGSVTTSKVIRNNCIDLENLSKRGKTIPFSKDLESKVYPNPTSNSVKITSGLTIEEINIINVLGETILTKKASTKNLEIDVSNLNTGIYILKIKCLENQVYTEKIIKK